MHPHFLRHFALALFVAFSACGGCNDETSQTNNELPPGCSDADEDGHELGRDCEVSTDCDDTDASINPDADEACGDEVDNDCDGDIDEGCEGPCEDGTTRECGRDEGACEVGSQECVDGEWGACDDIGPTSETCNGEDDDCDGEVDELGDELCDDGLVCNGVSRCEDGACTDPEMLDCSDLDGPCAEGRCSEKDRGCRSFPTENGSPCEDGNFCTETGTCSAGVCETQPRDCSSAGDECNVGVCDEDADECIAQPVSDGTSCDDGAFCTTGDTCTSGVCTGAARDCSSAADQCNTGVCDDDADACVPSPVNDGTACDDGMYCNVGETCIAGACAGGAARDCSAQGGSCRTGTCNETTDSCDGPPVADGTACDDNQFCTLNDSCVGGICAGGAMRDCSTASGLCQIGDCDDTINQCVPVDAPDGSNCDDGQFCTDGDTCQSGACAPGPARDCSAAAGGDICLMGVCEESVSMCVAQMAVPLPPTCCNVNTDADLDGANECDDCNDTNGAVYPGAMEFCNGVDDDCDGMIDEDFDADGDGYATCGNDPLILDCDDNNAGVNPGMMENCGPGGNGNGLDDDCDGYVDEGCNCSDPPVDGDGDGSTDCDGDCDDMNPDTYPGATELCDGEDNDCNVFTTPNCGVSDVCNHDGDGDYSNDPDVCQDDMICAQEVNASGNGTGNFFCTSFCNTSGTGALGDGCTATQSCQYDLLRSANVHGCGERDTTPGSLEAGEACSNDDQCRSLSCYKPPGPGARFCLDYCGSDDYCAAGSTCRFVGEDGRCWPDGRISGSGAVGATCGSDFDCDHVKCVASPDDGQQRCTAPCCQDSDCPGGYTCSLRGDATDTSFVVPYDGAPSCGTAADCGPEDGDECFQGACAWRLVETSPMCVPDASGQGARVAGQSCTSNSQCASNFCELDLGVCIEVCCADSTCPTGLTCELATVETTSDRVTGSRVCLNLSTDAIIRRR